MTRTAGAALGGARFAPRVFDLPDALDVGELLARLRSRRGLVALDSAAGEPRRFSWVAFDPLRGVELPSDLAGLRPYLRYLGPSSSAPVPGPFQGGFMGALSYDLGMHGERALGCADDPCHSPRIVGGLYTDFIVRDERLVRSWLVLGETPGDERASVSERRAELTALLSAPDASSEIRPLGPLLRHTSAALHSERIERLRAWIGAGELYQANLAHRFTRRVAAHPIDIYRRLRAVNPAPYMAYLSWDAQGDAGGALLSASPELLFEFDGATARTRPIKGTAARAADPAQDARLAQALLHSAKDLAELSMIVDLERNDLGRVARAGSVRVEHFPRLSSYARVHHLSADVVAQVRADVDALDILCALFPGGSITGAPKQAAMRAIAELEGEGRGFTGSLGFIDTRGRAAFNILIRTMVWRPLAHGAHSAEDARRDQGEITFHVGSGITWSSIAAEEVEETLAKGAALEAALESSAQVEMRGA